MCNMFVFTIFNAVIQWYFGIFVRNFELNMTDNTHSIEIFDVTKDFVDSKYPVIHSDKNGFLLCKQGSIQLLLDDSTFNINAGDLYIYPPFSQTFIKEVSYDFLGVVGIADFDFVLSTIIQVSNTQQHIYIRSRPCVTLNQHQQRNIEELISVMKNRIAEIDRPLRAQILSALVQTVCFEILDAYLDGLSISPLYQNQRDKIFHRFIQDCFMHFKKHREVKFYAELQHLTPRYFSTVIREVSGKTPMDWINLSIITEAKKLLVTPDLNIKEIAIQLNFEDQSLFGRYFKRITGLSPSNFRAKQNIACKRH